MVYAVAPTWDVALARAALDDPTLLPNPANSPGVSPVLRYIMGSSDVAHHVDTTVGEYRQTNIYPGSEGVGHSHGDAIDILGYPPAPYIGIKDNPAVTEPIYRGLRRVADFLRRYPQLHSNSLFSGHKFDRSRYLRIIDGADVGPPEPDPNDYFAQQGAGDALSRHWDHVHLESTKARLLAVLDPALWKPRRIVIPPPVPMVQQEAALTATKMRVTWTDGATYEYTPAAGWVAVFGGPGNPAEVAAAGYFTGDFATGLRGWEAASAYHVHSQDEVQFAPPNSDLTVRFDFPPRPAYPAYQLVTNEVWLRFRDPVPIVGNQISVKLVTELGIQTGGAYELQDDGRTLYIVGAFHENSDTQTYVVRTNGQSDHWLHSASARREYRNDDIPEPDFDLTPAPMRQRQRDDGLATSAPRQGGNSRNAPTSRQRSIRQGRRNTYR